MIAKSELIKKSTYKIDSEKLAYWYFRLNGFLTIENFVVHPNSGSQQRTEVDILATRFPYRKELPKSKNPIQDDERLILDSPKIRVILAEVKKNECELNDSWTNPDKENMQQIISAIGLFNSSNETKSASNSLYDYGFFKNNDFFLSFCCLGCRQDSDTLKRYPKVPQLTWEEVLSFIYKRFKEYEKQKRNHQQWDNTGKNLWKYFEKCSCEDDFCTGISVSAV